MPMTIIDAFTEGLRTPDMKENLEALTAQMAALEARAAICRAPCRPCTRT